MQCLNGCCCGLSEGELEEIAQPKLGLQPESPHEGDLFQQFTPVINLGMTGNITLLASKLVDGKHLWIQLSSLFFVFILFWFCWWFFFSPLPLTQHLKCQEMVNLGDIILVYGVLLTPQQF